MTRRFCLVSGRQTALRESIGAVLSQDTAGRAILAPMRWTKDNASLTWEDGTLALTAPGLSLRVAAHDHHDTNFECAAARALGGELVAEVQAAVRNGAPLARMDAPRDRPHRPRLFGFGGRGSTAAGAWIFGRHVRLSRVRGPDVAFETVLAHGLPEGHGLTPDAAQALVEAVQALAPWPCFCGTGAETFEQHGALERLAGPFQHPDAPITHQASVGRCRVCGRAAVLLESGDSHYDFRYEVLPLRGPDADPPR